MAEAEMLPGEDPASRYGDQRLGQRARHLTGGGGGEVREVFRVREEGDTLNIRCQVCEMTVFGLRNLNNHINGKKHQGKFTSQVSAGYLCHLI